MDLFFSHDIGNGKSSQLTFSPSFFKMVKLHVIAPATRFSLCPPANIAHFFQRKIRPPRCVATGGPGRATLSALFGTRASADHGSRQGSPGSRSGRSGRFF